MMWAPTGSQPTRGRGEPTLPLINIVFLMLIFFLVTAQMARPIDPDLQLVLTDDEAFVPPPDAVIIDAAGDVRFRGLATTADAVLIRLRAEQGGAVTVRLLPDRRAPATEVVRVAHALRRAGAVAVHLVTAQGI